MREVDYDQYEEKFDRRRHKRLATNLTGEYSGTFGSVVLTQRGKRLTGTYVAGGGGTIDAVVRRDGMIDFTWHNYGEGPHGRGVWTLNRRSNRIEGTWGTNESLTDGGAWNLVRQR